MKLRSTLLALLLAPCSLLQAADWTISTFAGTGVKGGEGDGGASNEGASSRTLNAGGDGGGGGGEGGGGEGEGGRGEGGGGEGEGGGGEGEGGGA